MADHDVFLAARLKRELPRLTRRLGRGPTRSELLVLGFDGAGLKRLEAAGFITSRLAVIDSSGAKRRIYRLPRGG